MPFTEIAVIVISWAVITLIGFVVIRKNKGERATYFGGCVFLVLGFCVPLLLTAFLEKYLVCAQPLCEAAKIQASSLISLFTISWAAIGANLLAAFLSNK